MKLFLIQSLLLPLLPIVTSFSTPSDNAGGPPPDLVDKQKFIKTIEIMPNPGFDLSESVTGGLVVVSQVTGNSEEAGMQIGDTITGVTAAGIFKSTKEMTLEQTGTILMESAENALRNGAAEFELDLNRLIKLAYAD